jgi:hypothetical protein
VVVPVAVAQLLLGAGADREDPAGLQDPGELPEDLRWAGKPFGGVVGQVVEDLVDHDLVQRRVGAFVTYLSYVLGAPLSLVGAAELSMRPPLRLPLEGHGGPHPVDVEPLPSLLLFALAGALARLPNRAALLLHELLESLPRLAPTNARYSLAAIEEALSPAASAM